MTKKEIRKIAKQFISDGKSRQDTFDELSENSSIPLADLALIIRRISSLGARNKHRILNYLLIVLLSLTIALRMLSGIPMVLEKGLIWFPIILFLPLIDILMLIGVSSYHYLSYLWVAIFSLLGLLGVILRIALEPTELLHLVDLAFIGALVFLGFYLKAKLFPYYWTKKEVYQNEFGENRMRYVFQFEN